MGRLKLTVNEEKTRICKVPDGEFDFLGYTFGRMYSPTTGKARLGYRPSKKSIKRIVEKVHALTDRAGSWQFSRTINQPCIVKSTVHRRFWAQGAERPRAVVTLPKRTLGRNPVSPKQARFVEEYLIDLNAKQAAIRAGYSAKTAAVIGAQNLTKLNVAEAIEKAKAKRSERTELTADWVIDQAAILTSISRP
jgi:hypothetical protein